MAKRAPRFKIKGVSALKVALDPAAMEKCNRREMKRETWLNGKLAVAKVRQVIRSGVPPRNAALTQAIKGGDKPLVDSSELFNSVAAQVVDDFTVFVGVSRTNGAYNIAAIVHEGATIRVTPKMRALFFALWQVSIGNMSATKLSARGKELYAKSTDWKPLRQSTTVIRIPARKFVEIALSDPTLIAKAKANWTRGLNAAFKERATSGRNTPDGK